jgi:hypothetical protein
MSSCARGQAAQPASRLPVSAHRDRLLTVSAAPVTGYPVALRKAEWNVLIDLIQSCPGAALPLHPSPFGRAAPHESGVAGEAEGHGRRPTSIMHGLEASTKLDVRQETVSEHHVHVTQVAASVKALTDEQLHVAFAMARGELKALPARPSIEVAPEAG